MSLSKIVTNLRNKLKDEEKRNQSISNKLDQILKEKEQIKQKLSQLQKELKMRGGSVTVDNRGSFATAPYQAPSLGNQNAAKSLGAVKSRINTGRSAESSRNQQDYQHSTPRKMSFKQRRDSYKEQSTGKSNLESTQSNVDSLSRKQASTLGRTQAKINSGISNLRDTRNKTKTGGHEAENMALSAEIDDLQQQVKVELASGDARSSKKRQYLLASQQQTNSVTQPKMEPDQQFLTSDSQPETVPEEPDLEGSD